MYIGLIIYGRLDTLTGGYIYDRMLAEQLRQRGHRVEVVSLPRRHYVRNLLDNFTPGLVTRLASAGYDLLLQDELIHPSCWRINRRLKNACSCPIIAIVHQVLCRQPRSGLLNRLYERVERTYLNSVDAYIYNSNSTRRNVERLARNAQRSMVAFPAGNRLGSLASTDQVESRASAPGPLKLIQVGNLLPNKGLLTLIEDLANLPAKNWRLTVVGSLEIDPVYFRKVEKLVAAANLDSRVAFLGQKDGPELVSHLSQSHVFVMPYSHEGFGMAYLEAMGFALPVIASADGAVKEFVKPERNGFLVDPADRDKTLSCLNRLHRDRQLLIDMSRAAWKAFQEHPRWDHTVERIERFLSDLVSH